MIALNHTQESNGIIEYVDQNGDVMKSYPIAELDKFVYEHGMNVTSVNPATPEDGETTEISTEQYITDNWIIATTSFWNHMNPSAHVAKQTPQQTQKQLR